MRVVNVHQATSKDKGLQRVVLKALERQLGQHENVMGIMGGDFNANANGDRTGYAESNKQHLDGVDRKFEDFAIRTGGTILSSKNQSRKSDDGTKAARLDHLVVWHLPVQETEGRADWVGGPMHDHARVSYRVAEEDFEVRGGAQGQKDKTDGTKRIAAKEWESAHGKIAPLLAEEAGVLASRVERGTLQADEARKQVLRKRQEEGEREHKKSGGMREDRIVGRAPHRNHEQVTLLQDIARLKASKKEGIEKEWQTVAQNMVLQELGLDEELTMTREEKVKMVKTAEWKAWVQKRLEFKEKPDEETSRRE